MSAESWVIEVLILNNHLHVIIHNRLDQGEIAILQVSTQILHRKLSVSPLQHELHELERDGFIKWDCIGADIRTSKVLRMGWCGLGGFTSSIAKSVLGFVHSISTYSEQQTENQCKKEDQNETAD